MTATTRAVQGAPCWVSLLTHDLEAAQDFYGEVLGWEYKAGFQKHGTYSVALAHGRPVAGMGMTATTRFFPTSWTSYFCAHSADRVAERVRERGATVAVGPIEFGKGRMALAADRGDAVFGIWEGEVDPEWRVGRKAGAPAWLELRTGDPFEAALFYGEVFEWDAQSPDRVDVRFEADRVVLRVEGHHVADLAGGAVEAAPDPHIRPQWHVYFCVDDVDATAEKSAAAGGTVVTPPHDSHFGPVAALRDPLGGLFHIACGDCDPSATA